MRARSQNPLLTFDIFQILPEHLNGFVLSFLTVLLWGRSDHSVSLVYYTTVIGGVLGCSCSERSKLLLLI